MEMHVIGLLSPWEIPFAERSASILACVFSAFDVRFRSWLPTVYLVVCLAFLVVVVVVVVVVGLALRLVILSFFLCLRLLFFLFSLSFLSFIDVLLLVLHLVLCSLSSFLS